MPPKRKLDPVLVEERLRQGKSYSEIASEFGVAKSTIGVCRKD